MGCCGGPNPNKIYSFKEYFITAVVIIAIILAIYYFKKIY